MTKYRKLHCQILESDDFNDMPDDFTRLTWTLLMLVLDREGRALDNLANLRAKIYPLREDVTNESLKAAFDWFADHKLIVRYQVEGKKYFYQVNFYKYQGDTRREGYSIYPAPPGWKSPNDDDEDDTESEVEPEPVEEPAQPSQELVLSSSRPTQDLLSTNSRSSSSSTSASSSALTSTSSSEPPAPSGAISDKVFSLKPEPIPTDSEFKSMRDKARFACSTWRSILGTQPPGLSDMDNIGMMVTNHGLQPVLTAMLAVKKNEYKKIEDVQRIVYCYDQPKPEPVPAEPALVTGGVG